MATRITTPPSDRAADEWAEEFYRFNAGDPEQGAYRRHRVPFWREIFAAARDPLVREITVVTGAQMSKTTGLIVMAMHRMHEGPRTPVMFVEPSKDLAKSVAERMNAAIELCAPLYEMMEKGRRARLLERYFAGVRIGFAWAGSKIQLRSHPVGLGIADEIDAYPTDVEGEGHPLVLLAARLKNYIRALLLKTGTPTVQGASAVEQSFLLGSREVLQWQCPHCHQWYQPLPAHMQWPKDSDPVRAELDGWLCCGECGAHIDDELVPELRRNARWWPYDETDDGVLVPAAVRREGGSHRSFWATGIFSPWVTAAQLRRRLAEAYASKDVSTIKAELNTWWGVWWQEAGERPQWEQVKHHVGQYQRGQLPPGVRGIILAVDVQQDRLEWSVVGFGANFSKHVIDWGQLWGDPEYDNVWLALSQFQARKYGSLGIQRCIVDSGYQPGYDWFQRPQHKVYEFCRRHFGWAYSYKGYAEQRETVRLSKSQRDGILYLVNASYFKRLIYAEIRTEESNLHVPIDVTDDYCRQLVSEEQITLPSGRVKWKVRRSEPNHQLDCLVMALAAAYTLNWQQIQIDTPAPNQPAPEGPRIRMPGFRRRY